MTTELEKQMNEFGAKARRASSALAVAASQLKNEALQSMAQAIEQQTEAILAANSIDVAAAEQSGTSQSFVDRLKLDHQRVAAMAEGMRKIADLPEPVGKILSSTQRPNGLVIEKVTMPIGVIGVIYESRPNVTADAAALCLKSGNAVILRGGSAAQNSNLAIYNAMTAGLDAANLCTDVIQVIGSTDRAAVGAMLSGLDGTLDVIVPRGGKSLVERVQNESRIPVFAHLEGLCHTYVHSEAAAKMAMAIVGNAKMRRTGICGATETILVDREFDAGELASILDHLVELGCEVRGDEAVQSVFPAAKAAQAEDWSQEYLDAIVSVKIVANCEEAIGHIETFGTGHTECIITENQGVADHFLKHVGSAIVMHNTSTQFADGGEFGMGAEIGIATGKLHARGPVGVEQLTTFKYLVRGNGQVRS